MKTTLRSAYQAKVLTIRTAWAFIVAIPLVFLPGVNYGLARGYSAVGNYPAALEALLKAQKQVPAGDTINPPAIEANIEKLRRGENIN